LYLYFHFEPVAPYVTGAVQPKLSQGRMNMMPFVFAGEDICRAFRELSDPWFARLRSCAEETRTLTAVRDALLPKLISGELRVKDAKRFVGAAA
jgi:type I restriction enzyme S subunit